MIDCLRGLLRPVFSAPGAAALVALALTAGAAAQTVPASTPPATPAATVPVSSMSSRVLACTACHGKEGRATPDGYFPRIAGKPAGYLANQLLNFRDGRRSYPQMTYLIEHLTDDYLREMAEHFAALDLPYPPPPAPQAPAAVLEQGRKLVQGGDGARNIPACVGCHGAAMTGVTPSIPGLLGLPRDYLNSQLGAWKTGQRRAHLPDCMADVARQLTPDDVSAVSAWLAAQPVAAGGKPARTLPAAMPARCGGVAEVPVAAAAAR
ncbi:cytochrome c553 [Acidovorax sp. 94]|uniref:c-type cytochrome n=1 Tax=Acidovorax sp. 94 TaxID=2135633 RepID=UPI000EB2CA05|nr:c-type cytochrome [Acidovorax sp. 94]RKR67340.1 cytochrome c553 [Acidovorax sp. 94]